MTILTETTHPGGFIVWEAFRDYCREVVTIATGGATPVLDPGTVLGKITASGQYAAHDPAAVDGTETAVAVLWGRADATAAEASAVALLRGPAIVIRAFGSESETQQIQAEVARRLRRLRSDAEATFEYHLLNGIQGKVLDPRDGATVIDYFAEFALTPAAEVDFDLDNGTPAAGALRKRCQALIESVEETLGGLSTGAVQLRAECGSAFFADLVAHKEVRETYLNTAAAADLRSRVSDEVSFGGINFRRYRGNAAFGVPVDKAVFYPEGVEGLFEIYYAPADTFETVNTLGQPLYARAIPDRDRDEWVRLEIESNPLPICTRPQVLRSARRT